MGKVVKDIVEIKALAVERDGGVDVVLALAHGLRSSKTIWYDAVREEFEVENFIDGSTEYIKEKEVAESNIGKAITNGHLFFDE